MYPAACMQPLPSNNADDNAHDVKNCGRDILFHSICSTWIATYVHGEEDSHHLVMHNTHHGMEGVIKMSVRAPRMEWILTQTFTAVCGNHCEEVF